MFTADSALAATLCAPVRKDAFPRHGGRGYQWGNPARASLPSRASRDGNWSVNCEIAPHAPETITIPVMFGWKSQW
jgi:hypothetical protein